MMESPIGQDNASIGEVPLHDDDALNACIAHVTQEVMAELGPLSAWLSPILSGSLAQCVLNAIYSTGNRSETVVRVLDRYRQRRSEASADPDKDGPADLPDEIDSCGGPEGFADALGNHWRAWQSTRAPYKTQVIHEAAELLVAASVLGRGGPNGPERRIDRACSADEPQVLGVGAPNAFNCLGETH